MIDVGVADKNVRHLQQIGVGERRLIAHVEQERPFFVQKLHEQTGIAQGVVHQRWM